MSSNIVAPAAPNGDNGNHQGHCSQCGKIWTLRTRQGVCQWCNKPASCQSSTSKPHHIKSRSSGRRKQANGSGNGNGYDHLECKWLTYYKVASRFAHKAKAEDTEPATEADTEEAEAVAEAETIAKTEKPKRSRKREKVAVA